MASSSTTTQEESPTYDILTIGFGTTALSLAATLQSTKHNFKILHLDALPQSQWSPGVSLPSAHMRTSFIDDLVTGNDPRSKYTFVNFLHTRNLLVDYTNLGRVQPSRELVRAYLRWCGEELIKAGEVGFGMEVVGVEGVKSGNGIIGTFKVLVKEKESGMVKEFHAKRVVCAMGLKLRMPAVLGTSALRSSVVHAAAFRDALEQREKEGWTGRDVAVIGGGQHAAEVLELLNEKAPRYKVSAFMEERAFRAEEDTAFTNLALQTSHPLYPPELLRNHVLPSRLSYSTTSAPLLGSIYEAQYSQRIPSHHNKLRASAPQVFPNTAVVGAQRDGDGRIVLKISTGKAAECREQPFDLVVTGTGYQRHDYESLFKGLSEILDGSASVGRDYAVNFRRGAVAEGSGVWVLGMLGESGEDDIDDALFRILTERSRRVVSSMFGQSGGKRKVNEEQKGTSQRRPSVEDQARL